MFEAAKEGIPLTWGGIWEYAKVASAFQDMKNLTIQIYILTLTGEKGT